MLLFACRGGGSASFSTYRSNDTGDTAAGDDAAGRRGDDDGDGRPGEGALAPS